jgi:hypothetical protein
LQVGVSTPDNIFNFSLRACTIGVYGPTDNPHTALAASLFDCIDECLTAWAFDVFANTSTFVDDPSGISTCDAHD